MNNHPPFCVKVLLSARFQTILTESVFRSLLIGHLPKERVLSWVQTLSGIKSSSKNIFCVQFQVQELAELILARVTVKDLNIRIFSKFFLYTKPTCSCCHLHKQINSLSSRRKFTCLKPARTTFFDWTAPWNFLIFTIRFS